MSSVKTKLYKPKWSKRKSSKKQDKTLPPWWKKKTNLWVQMKSPKSRLSIILTCSLLKIWRTSKRIWLVTCSMMRLFAESWSSKSSKKPGANPNTPPPMPNYAANSPNSPATSSISKPQKRKKPRKKKTPSKFTWFQESNTLSTKKSNKFHNSQMRTKKTTGLDKPKRKS